MVSEKRNTRKWRIISTMKIAGSSGLIQETPAKARVSRGEWPKSDIGGLFPGTVSAAS